MYYLQVREEPLLPPVEDFQVPNFGGRFWGGIGSLWILPVLEGRGGVMAGGVGVDCWFAVLNNKKLLIDCDS